MKNAENNISKHLSLMNKDCAFGFCFDHIDLNKQRQRFVSNNDDKVYFRTHLRERLTFMWNSIYLYWSKNGVPYKINGVTVDGLHTISLGT